MKNKNRKKGRFFTLLLGNYMAFTLALVILMIAIVAISLLRMSPSLMQGTESQLHVGLHYLEEGKYTEFPVEDVLGDGGKFAVFDEDGKLVYANEIEKKYMSYSKEEFALISKFSDMQYRSVSKYKTDKNKINYLVEEFKYDDEAGRKITKEYIFDENYNILYTSQDSGKKTFTKREFKIFTNTLYSNCTVEKATFKTVGGQNYTVLLYIEKNADDTAYNKIGNVIKQAFAGFIICYLAMIALFILWLNHVVKKPINLLRGAIESFKHGSRQVYLNYRGPREFEEICETFNEMSQQLYESEQDRQKLEVEKQKMLADISHDLKTPVTVIQGYATAINDGIVSKEEESQYLSAIVEKSSAITELINIFYDYSKMEHPDYTLTLEPQDICVYLRNYMAEKYNEISIAGFELNIEIPEKHVICNIDKIQLKRVFENIIANTLKYNQSGVNIFVGLKVLTDQVAITIADDGYGISKELTDTIFQPFVVGEKARSQNGSGLGLAVVKKITEAHKGTIRLVNPPDESYKTQFEIILPIRKG